MSLTAITILLLVGTAFGVGVCMFLTRKLARAARHSDFWQGVFLKVTGFRYPKSSRVIEAVTTKKEEPKPTEPEPELEPDESPHASQLMWTPNLDIKGDDDKVLAGVLKSQLGFKADEVKRGLEVVRATIPYASLDQKVYAALRSRGAGIW